MLPALPEFDPTCIPYHFQSALGVQERNILTVITYVFQIHVHTRFHRNNVSDVSKACARSHTPVVEAVVQSGARRLLLAMHQLRRLEEVSPRSYSSIQRPGMCLPACLPACLSVCVCVCLCTCLRQRLKPFWPQIQTHQGSNKVQKLI